MNFFPLAQGLTFISQHLEKFSSKLIFSKLRLNSRLDEVVKKFYEPKFFAPRLLQTTSDFSFAKKFFGKNFLANLNQVPKFFEKRRFIPKFFFAERTLSVFLRSAQTLIISLSKNFSLCRFILSKFFLGFTLKQDGLDAHQLFDL
jgi:hypothetical protein